MAGNLSEQLTALRREKGLSQKQAAAELNISQALLSHYENGIREPRMDFLVRACDYYQVTADRMLGRSSGDDAQEKLMTESVGLLTGRLASEKPDTAAMAALCVQNAVDQLLYLLNNPGSVLPPELLIREQQGFADLIQTMTEEVKDCD